MRPSIHSILTLLRRQGREASRTLVDLLSPPACLLCELPMQIGGTLCRTCVATLHVRQPPWCRRCGRPLSEPPCQSDHRHLVGITAARAPFRYFGAGGDLVRAVKFSRDPAAARLLAQAMAASVRDVLRGPFRRAIVAAVPLHPRKRRRRGFDQTAWLADQIAAELGLPFINGALRRIRDTRPQGDVLVMSRARNVQGAFGLRRQGAIHGSTVLLVDDVTTSGSTARECAAVLRAGGAQAVVLLTAAVA